MRTKIYSLDEIQDSKISFAMYLSDKNSSSDPIRARMSKIIKTAMKNELTQRQRDCITMYYLKRKKVSEIADLLCIKPSTVYKHLHIGIKSLKKAALYL